MPELARRGYDWRLQITQGHSKPESLLDRRGQHLAHSLRSFSLILRLQRPSSCAAKAPKTFRSLNGPNPIMTSLKLRLAAWTSITTSSRPKLTGSCYRMTMLSSEALESASQKLFPHLAWSCFSISFSSTSVSMATIRRTKRPSDRIATIAS